MAHIDISGTTCDFKGMPLAVLVHYRPTTLTHYCIWSQPTSDDATITLYIRLLETMGEITSCHFYPIESNTGYVTACLYEISHETHPVLWYCLDMVGNKVSGGKWHHCCPYRVAINKDYSDKLTGMVELDRMIYERYRREGIRLKVSDKWKSAHDEIINQLSNGLDETAGAHDATAAARDGRAALRAVNQR